MRDQRVVRATYYLESEIAPARAAAILAGEQSSGTFVAVPGESVELHERHGAQVVDVQHLGRRSPSLPSRTRPVLISSLGQRIAAIGRLPYVGALGYATPFGPGPRRHNSAQRLHSLWRALTVPDGLAAAVETHAAAGPVLLVDDQIDTGWTMTVAGMLLRKAGASGVLPLALAVTTG